MKKEYICIICPKGCHIFKDGDAISGYTCLRGLEYVKQESIKPLRSLTSTVCVSNRDVMCPVKTSGPIPKSEIFSVMDKINSLKVEAPILFNQILVKNVNDLAVDIISTKEIK